MKLTKNKPVVISIRVTEDIANTLDEVSNIMGVKRNELVRIIVHSGCKGWDAQNEISKRVNEEVIKEVNNNGNDY